MEDIIFLPIGWIYLKIRYRDNEKIKKVLIEKYDNEYYIAGSMLFYNFFGVIFLGLILMMIIAAIVSLFK